MAVISLYPTDKTACGNYRLTWPGEALADNDRGHHVVVNEFRGDHEIDIPVWKAWGTHTITKVGPVEADVVVFQRPAAEAMLDIMEAVQEQGVKVVVEIDDALWSIDRDNRSWANYNVHERFHWKWLKRAMRMADLVTVTTPELLEQAGVEGEVVPNFIPESALKVGERKLQEWEDRGSQQLTVGWAATSVTHPRDPQATRGAVADWILDNPHRARFLSVGGKAEREPALFGFDGSYPGAYDATGEIKAHMWFEAVAELDVSLVPLADSKFNQAKSWLKGLESAAAGCAVVMSPTPDNVRLAERGIGLTARDHKWYKRLSQVGDSSLAYDQAVANWEAARARTIESNAYRWLDAWETVL